MLRTPRRVPALYYFPFLLALQSAAIFFSAPAIAQEIANPDAPSITKVEPPNWWVNLTPDVMLLLTGKNLQVTHANCNLPDVIVSRTQSMADGHYLFVWLRLSPNLKSGTAICRVTTPKGQAAFELPLAARKQILARNQGLSLDDVLYLIMPDRFANGDPTNDEPAEFPGSHARAKPRAWHGGDLRGVQDHLTYLKDLGVTTVWLTPIVTNGATQDYHGYGAVDLYAVDPHLGTLQDYQDLVAAAHKLHMKILFDVVPNHVGPLHPWVANPPTPDWFHGTANDHLSTFSPWKPDFYGQSDKRDVTNDLFEALEDPHTPPQMRANLTTGWFFGLLPDLNTENSLVVEYLTQNSIWWAESSGLDGFRIDTFPYVPRKFWAEWHSVLRKYYPRLSTIGEVFHPDPTVTSFFVGGRKGWDGIDTQLTTVFDFPTFFTLRDVLLKQAPVGKIANILRQDSLYPHPDFLISFFANHDVPRFASMPGSSIAKVKLAFGLTLTLRGIPELYYGDEIAMPGGNDPDNRRDFPGGWQGDEKNAFTAEGRTPEQQEVFAYVQKLLQLRREHAALRSGQLWHLSSDDTSYVFLRETEEEKLVIAFHHGTQPRELNISLGDTPAQDAAGAAMLFGNAQADVSAHTLHLRLPPQSLSIFVLQ
ncbi:MAG TPA: alpha-amylase family glycosyl hydrolase [Candidatus Acidoferrum sp.]|nr:alpha-amylase family glycosyl hydrolase [Candidatus Acidoferrum sp.]